MNEHEQSLRNATTTVIAACFMLAACVAPTEDSANDEELVESGGSAIVGGQPTSGYAAVGALTRGGAPFCTGTLVTSRAVVTAAHCLEGLRASSVRFALGPNGFAPQASIPVARVVPHPSYDRRRLTSDIGVLVLAADAPVAPVAINTAMDSSWVGRSLVFVGYGATNGFTGGGGGGKRAVSIPVSQVGSTQFAYADRNRNTCFGDSGGPAFATDASGALRLVGVTSYGDSTCSSYGVDTRVDVFRSFVAAAVP